MEWTPRPLVEHLREQERHNVTLITVGWKYEVYVWSRASSHMQTFEQPFRTLAIKWEVTIIVKKPSGVFLHASVFIMVSLWCCRWLYNSIPADFNRAMIRIVFILPLVSMILRSLFNLVDCGLLLYWSSWIRIGCIKCSQSVRIGWLVLVWFHGISTIVGYLTPKTVYAHIIDSYDLPKYCYVPQAFQINISHLFTYSKLIKQFYFKQFNLA